MCCMIDLLCHLSNLRISSSLTLLTRKHFSPDGYCNLWQVNAAAEVIYDLVDPSANLIFGAVIDPSLSGQVSVHSCFVFHREKLFAMEAWTLTLTS